MSDCADQETTPSTSWDKIGPYAIRKGRFQISKACVDGSTVYVTWEDGIPGAIGYSATIDEAMEKCE